MTNMGFLSPVYLPRPASQPGTSRCRKSLQPQCSAQAEKAKGRKRVRPAPGAPPENGRLISEISVGDEFIGTVVNVGPANSSWVDIGVFTKRGRPVHGRLPFVLKKDGYTRNATEGAVISVYVMSVNRNAGRIELRRGLKPQNADDAPAVVTMLDSLRVGDKLKGTVVGLGPYGAVLDTNVHRIGKGGKTVTCPGLLRRKSFRKDWYSAADQVFRRDAEICISKGDAIDVYVRAAQVPNALLLLDANEVNPEEVQEARRLHRAQVRRRKRRAPVNSLQAGQIRDGAVAAVKRYGVFVDIGVKSNGLLHYSKMGEQYKQGWREALVVNTRVSVEVLEIEGNNISLRLISLKEAALREAVQAARLPTARLEDVKRAAILQASSSHHLGRHVTSSDYAKETGTASEKHGYEHDENDETGEDHEAELDDDEEQDKFSDEYFEDKYGF